MLRITDGGASRGDGAFETIGVWDGRPFRLGDHLRRLNGSLRALHLPPSGDLSADVAELLRAAGPVDAALRLYVTGSGTRVLTLSDQPVRSPIRRLVPQPAPWVRPTRDYALAGAKTMSYAANMTASRAAKAAGGDDALLLANEGWVLEGPTFAVLWVTDGVLRTPELALGIVDSISRRALLELAGLPVEHGRWRLDELAAASEVMLCSAIRDVEAVAQVDGAFSAAGPTPARDALSAALSKARRA